LEELEHIKGQIHTANELQSLVRVMKSIAASLVREYGESAAAIEEYGNTIVSGLQILMHNKHKKIAVEQKQPSRIGAVILGTDQGLCGDFNERIGEFAAEKLADLRKSSELTRTLAIGEKVAYFLEDSGNPVDDRFSFLGESNAITTVIINVLETLDKWESTNGVNKIILFFNKPTQESTFASEMKILLPVDIAWLEELASAKWPCRTIPTFTMPWADLFESEIRNYLFFVIYRAFVDSLVSENISRFQAMLAASHHIDERLIELKLKYHRVRQGTIDEELLDISTGYRSVMETDGLNSTPP
jgi:F-type H+-transporting ATPase subunit gamma